jgi:hypothetical protein
MGKAALKMGLARATTLLWTVSIYAVEIVSVVAFALDVALDTISAGHTDEEIERSVIKQFVYHIDCMRKAALGPKNSHDLSLRRQIPMKADAVAVKRPVVPLRKK